MPWFENFDLQLDVNYVYGLFLELQALRKLKLCACDRTF